MTGEGSRGAAFAPLRHVAFRRIWLASLPSNFGLLINGVGAGWAMTEMSGRPQDVALVQTALMLPYMLFSMAAGAISDTYDRRRVSMVMLTFACAGASLLTLTDFWGLLTPTILLLLCFLIGTANSMFGPAWQSSVSEQVPSEELPAAVGLNSVSYNIARSFGPALGGLIVAAAGSMAAFAANALCYLPILAALALWRRNPEPPRLPPERTVWAILSGVRYIAHSPPMRAVIVRCVCTGIAGATITSLMPLISRDLLHGGPSTYGILLGAFGLGAVAGALVLGRLRRGRSAETHVAASTAVVGTAVVLLSLSRWEPADLLILVVAGAAWIQVLTSFNVLIQTRAPRWVAGRALAAYQASTAGGLALGSWGWGSVAGHVGTSVAVGLSGCALVGCAGLGMWLRLPEGSAESGDRLPRLTDPEVELDLTGRSGPIVVEIEYDVEADRARPFYGAMLEVGRFRQRNGAYQWTLARDIAAPQRWVERFSCPTWDDYLRQRDRMTAEEQMIMDNAFGQTISQNISGIRRMLERPLGSVRWKNATPDPGIVLPVG